MIKTTADSAKHLLQPLTDERKGLERHEGEKIMTEFSSEPEVTL